MSVQLTGVLIITPAYKFMKKNKLNTKLVEASIFLAVLYLALVTPQVSAQVGTLTVTGAPNISVTNFVVTAVNFALGSGVAVFLLYFMWGAFQWTVSAGEKAALEQARGRMTSAAIGLVILSSIWAIFGIVQMITYSST